MKKKKGNPYSIDKIMGKRDYSNVVSKMIESLPHGQRELIENLQWDLATTHYRDGAAEKRKLWVNTSKTLIKHIPTPEKNWQWKVISIFTGKTVNELKAYK